MTQTQERKMQCENNITLMFKLRKYNMAQHIHRNEGRTRLIRLGLVKPREAQQCRDAHDQQFSQHKEQRSDSFHYSELQEGEEQSEGAQA